MPTTDDATYEKVAELIDAAERKAEDCAGDDPFSDWAVALSAITLARIPTLPSGLPDVPEATCTGLLGEALRLLDAVDRDERRPSHSLDRAYLAAALAQAEELDE
jgi:hypothetical protein